MSHKAGLVAVAADAVAAADHVRDILLNRRIVDVRDTYADAHNPHSFIPGQPESRNIQLILDNGESVTFGWTDKRGSRDG